MRGKKVVKKHAEGTGVSVNSSRNAIIKMLEEHGCEKAAIGWDPNGVVVMFETPSWAQQIHHATTTGVGDVRRVRFVLSIPSEDDAAFRSKTYYRSAKNNAASRKKKYEAEVRRIWRSFSILLAHKLEMVASGVTTYEEEFLAHILLPDTNTVHEWLRTQLQTAYLADGMPWPLDQKDT